MTKKTTMTKATVTRLFIGGGLAIIAGAILAIAAVWIAIANDVFVMNGPDVVGLRGSGLAASMLGLAIVGALAIMGGLIAGLVAWIGALLNTWQLESKAWFIALLLLGIFNFGFFAMVAYLLGGPDGASDAALRRAQAAARPTPA
jgi:hypothetical protein